MSDLASLLPLALLLLVPVWIPLGAAAIGTVRDRLRPPVPSPAQAAVEQARRRAEETRSARVLA
ncbi:hypothetical protein [Nocardioides phosphati]|uniref:hypothetical protein n=1 Tax=Nocardioides phosphati TaxID=1867775 RepID=UPI00166D122B|nr:hypothetical protein [Nocardioides phosphati]